MNNDRARQVGQVLVIAMDDQLLARTREELGATTHQLAEKEGFDLKYFYNKKKVRQCAE